MCIDLFAGAGGLSAGFQRRGFEVAAALESVSRFAQTHEQNFPQCKTITADASELPPDVFAERVSLPRRPEVIIGGPPCQTFSTIGRAKIRHVRGCDKSDPRNYMFQRYLDYVKYFEPEIFVMENVPQLKSRFGGVLFDRLIDLSSSFGYQVQFSVLNAADYGVPQNRKRLFIVGHKAGVKFSFPKPFVQGGQLVPSQYDDSKVRTVGEALEDLPLIYDGCRLGELPYSKEARTEFQFQVRSDRGVVGNNVCRVSNDRAKRVFKHMRQGDRYMDLDPEVRKILPFREDIFQDRLKRLREDEPSWTVLAHIGMDGYMYIHPWEDRTLSVREAARLQSFHDDFTFVGNMREQYVQVGNAVPPLLASEIAGSVMAAIQ
ncbi:DNA cytosine methyltransferase [Erythrobacter sp. LQ02-29]|uniref:DNA cytosine methyltransferase n=1 Tax=Erythrobacter sp. LQ02-29 TaxID=2920384 RepID=UPI001F4E7AEA|nr:DNA cytosine methyltransferase [Erythrobacter sp. LQ02-29]MCP9223808.1 DNA cytosine methyltransferase [Erythrobacter sp. LQ02-29]